MAYVAISGQFLDDVKKNIDNMAQAEHRSLESQDYRMSGASDFIQNAIWGEHLQLRDQLPKEWKGSTGQIGVDFKKDIAGASKHCFTIDLNPPAVTPPNYRSYDDHYVDPEHPDFKPFVEVYTKHKEVDQRWNEVRKQVIEYLKKCKSLNEAFKLWPQVMMYIPKNYAAKLDEKKTRTASGDNGAATFLEKMNTDQLTAAAVIARMAGAK